jgi:hypothetical protein
MNPNIYELSIAIVWYIFKCPEITSYCNKGFCLNEIFYEETYYIVHKRLKEIDDMLPEFYKRLDVMDGYINILSELSAKNLSKLNKFIISYAYCRHLISIWGKPRKLNFSINDDRAEYLLDGLFKIFCHANTVYNDDTMIYINKDIYDRVYTLLCKQKILYP